MRLRDENKAAAIRQKALEMIVKEGFDGMSMQKLAKAALVSPATIYIYFKNREDLLNQLFHEVQQTFTDVALDGFDPKLSFEAGLWIQWQNRIRFVVEKPTEFRFYEQFRNSPLLNHNDVKITDFKESMRNFVKNAFERGEIERMEPEIFWSMAYGPLYSILRFHLDEKNMMGRVFRLTDENLKKVFTLVIKAFKP